MKYSDKKELTINGKYRIPYDHLMLCTGSQYQVPASLREQKQAQLQENESGCAKEKSFREGFKPKIAKYEKPDNVLLLNDDYDVASCLHIIETLVTKNQTSISLRFSIITATFLNLLQNF